MAMSAAYTKRFTYASRADPQRIPVDTHYGVSRGSGSSRPYNASSELESSILSANDIQRLNTASGLQEKLQSDRQHAQLMYTDKKKQSLERLRRYAQAATLSRQEENDWQDELAHLESIEQQWEEDKATFNHGEKQLRCLNAKARNSKLLMAEIQRAQREDKTPQYHTPPQKRPFEGDYSVPNRLRPAPTHAADVQISPRAAETARQSSHGIREPQARQLPSKYYYPTTLSMYPATTQDKALFGNSTNGTRSNLLQMFPASLATNNSNKDFTSLHQLAAESHPEYLPAIAYNPNAATSATARAPTGVRSQREVTQRQQFLNTVGPDLNSRPGQVAGSRSAAAIPVKSEYFQNDTRHHSDLDASCSTQYNGERRARKAMNAPILIPGTQLHDGKYPITPPPFNGSRDAVFQHSVAGRERMPILVTTRHVNTGVSSARPSNNPTVKDESLNTPVSDARRPNRPTVKDEPLNTPVSSTRRSYNPTVEDESPNTPVSDTPWSYHSIVEEQSSVPSQEQSAGSSMTSGVEVKADTTDSKLANAQEDLQYDDSPVLSPSISSPVLSPSADAPSPFNKAASPINLPDQKIPVTIPNAAKVEAAECNPDVLDLPRESCEPTSHAASIKSLNETEPSVNLENTSNELDTSAESSEEESEDKVSDAAPTEVVCAADNEVDKSQTSATTEEESESPALTQAEPSTVASQSTTSQDQFASIVEEIEQRAVQLQMPYVGKAVQEICNRGVHDDADIANLMRAVVSPNMTAKQAGDFQHMVQDLKKELKAADKEGHQQSQEDAPAVTIASEDTVDSAPNDNEERTLDAAAQDDERALEDDLEELSLTSSIDTEHDIVSQLEDSPWEQVDTEGMDEDEDYNLQVQRANPQKVGWTEAARRKAWSWVR